MATKPEQMYHDIVKLVMYDCPLAQLELVQRKLIEAMRKLARETCLLQTSIVPMLEDNVADYDLAKLLPDGFEICEIMWVSLQGCCIDPVGECNTFCACGYSLVDQDCIRLHPAPCGYDRNQLEVKVAVVPCFDVCTIPKDFTKHYELLHEMVTVSLLRMPKKPWSDAREASFRLTAIKGEIADIRTKVAQRLAPKTEDHQLNVAI